VINYELPESAELFTHRIGRTGRMDREGEAITLIAPEDALAWRNMQRELKSKPQLQLWPHDVMPLPARQDQHSENAVIAEPEVMPEVTRRARPDARRENKREARREVRPAARRETRPEGNPPGAPRYDHGAQVPSRAHAHLDDAERTTRQRTQRPARRMDGAQSRGRP
jgi:superfamily II DNA/RNA helicase